MKRYWLLWLLAGCAYASPAPSTLISNIPGRTTVSLNGSWRAIVDPYENGKSGIFRDAKPKDKSDLVETALTRPLRSMFRATGTRSASS